MECFDDVWSVNDVWSVTDVTRTTAANLDGARGVSACCICWCMHFAGCVLRSSVSQCPYGLRLCLSSPRVLTEASTCSRPLSMGIGDAETSFQGPW